MNNKEIPAETIRQFLAAAHSMLTHSGFNRLGGDKAPRTAKTDRGPTRLIAVAESSRLSDLQASLRRSA